MLVPRKINRLSKISKVKCKLELSGYKDTGDGWKEMRREKQRPREGGQDLGLPQALGFPVYNAMRCILPGNPPLLQEALCVPSCQASQTRKLLVPKKSSNFPNAAPSLDPGCWHHPLSSWHLPGPSRTALVSCDLDSWT